MYFPQWRWGPRRFGSTGFDPECSAQQKPLKEHDPALDALRYLVLAIDAHKLARGWRRWLPHNHDADAPPPPPKPKPRPWLSLQNEVL
jgi:hypothetical protein